MVAKSGLFIILLGFRLVFYVVGQQDEAVIYTYIKEVTVLETNARFFCEDKPTFHVDLKQVQNLYCENLGELLINQSPAMVRLYGSQGSLASLTLRGTGSNHTQVSWNGFAINSPTTGQADLSLVPAGFMQQINVVNGASGALFGSGTFGGSVSLTNKPDWSKRFGIIYSGDAGSFGTLSNFVSAHIGGKHIQYSLSFIRQDTDNDFPFNDRYKYGNPVVKRTHNACFSNGLLQNLYFNLPDNNMVEAGFWYQKKSLEVPALMGDYNPSNAMQKDSTLKLYLVYRKVFDKSYLVIKNAWFTDYLRYTDKINPEDYQFSLDSKLDAGRFLNEIEYRYYLSKRIVLGTGMNYNHLVGISNNYGDPVHENELSVAAFAKLNLNKWIGNLGFRQEFYSDADPVPMFSIGWRYDASRHIVFRTNIANKFRKPTFNEKYWKPGGNPELKPEKGWGGDAGIQGELLPAVSASSVQYSLSGFFQSIDNWIQWVILDSLTPVEYRTVHAGGIEAAILYEFVSGNFTLNSAILYNLNHSVIVRTYDNNPVYTGKQLMYVPKHTARINFNLDWKNWSVAININSASRRQTVDSNDETLQLKGYIIPDIQAGYRNKFESGSVRLGFRIENILNRQYEIIRAYPMPGRAFYVTATVEFVKKQKNL